MQSVDIRTGTVIVIRKDGKYLSRKGTALTGGATWDPHLSNAWKTRIKTNALAVAQKFGGEPVLYNKFIGKTMEIGGEKG